VFGRVLLVGVIIVLAGGGGVFVGVVGVWWVGMANGIGVVVLVKEEYATAILRGSNEGKCLHRKRSIVAPKEKSPWPPAGRGRRRPAAAARAKKEGTGRAQKGSRGMRMRNGVKKK